MKSSWKRLSNSTNGLIYDLILTHHNFKSRLSFLEEDKYDFEVKHDFLKQELKQHRQRVNDLMGAKAKGKINTRK